MRSYDQKLWALSLKWNNITNSLGTALPGIKPWCRCPSSYLIVVTSQFTDKLDMLFSNTVHLSKEIVLNYDFVFSSLCSYCPLLLHAVKVGTHLKITHQSNLDISEKRHYWELLSWTKCKINENNTLITPPSPTTSAKIHVTLFQKPTLITHEFLTQSK